MLRLRTYVNMDTLSFSYAALSCVEGMILRWGIKCYRKEILIATVLYKTKSLVGTKPNTNPKTNPNPNTKAIHLFFLEHRQMIFKLSRARLKIKGRYSKKTHKTTE